MLLQGAELLFAGKKAGRSAAWDDSAFLPRAGHDPRIAPPFGRRDDPCGRPGYAFPAHGGKAPSRCQWQKKADRFSPNHAAHGSVP